MLQIVLSGIHRGGSVARSLVRDDRQELRVLGSRIRRILLRKSLQLHGGLIVLPALEQADGRGKGAGRWIRRRRPSAARSGVGIHRFVAARIRPLGRQGAISTVRGCGLLP
jgi:hypothetical protein